MVRPIFLDITEIFPLAVSLVVIGTVIASGPIVPTFQISPNSSPDSPPGHGTANVSTVNVSSTMTLDRGRFGANTFSVTSKPTKIRIEEVRGTPHLEYVLRIPRLDYATITFYPLSGRSGTVMDLAPKASEISPTLVTDHVYTGKLEIRLQANNFRTLHEGNVTIRTK